MHKQIVINSTANEVRVALMEDHQLVEVSMERADSKRVVGNVYKGIVTAVRPGLQAAFVDIGMEKAGFLHVSDLASEPQNIAPTRDDRGGRGRGRPRMRGRREGMRPIEQLLKEGQEIIVQVTKEVIGTKGPRLTADISLPGRFLVMMPYGDHVGVSRKIDDRRERSRLRDMLDRVKPTGRGAYIIRTAGDGMNEDLLRQDTDYLRGLWDTIDENSRTQPAPSLLHEDVGMIVGLVRDIFKEDVNALHIDNRRDFDQLNKYVEMFAPELKDRLQLYSGNVAIFDKFGIEAEIKKSLDKKVWLNRGGFLVIEQTEALVAIDINTGRYTGKKNQEETILRTNMMAAREIPRQLRLRDIGGIIVIDFIDMENEADKRRVLNELRTYLKYDRARTKSFAVSDLGLIEMSRQRVRESVKDQLSDECPFCRGTGQVLSIDTLLNKVERMVEKVPLISRDRKIQIQASPSLAVALQVERGDALRELARTNGMKLDILDDGRLHREDFKIVALGNRRDLVPELEDGRKALSAGERQRSRSEGSRGGRAAGGRRRREDSRDGGDQRERSAEPGRRSPSREKVAAGSEGSGGRGRSRRGRRGGAEVGDRNDRNDRSSRRSAEGRSGTERGGRDTRRREEPRREEPRREASSEMRDAAGESASNERGSRRRRRRGRGGSRRRERDGAPNVEHTEDRQPDREVTRAPRAEASEAAGDGRESRDGGRRRRRRRGGAESPRSEDARSEAATSSEETRERPPRRRETRTDEAPREESTWTETTAPVAEDRAADEGSSRRRRRVRRRGGGGAKSQVAAPEAKSEAPRTERPREESPRSERPARTEERTPRRERRPEANASMEWDPSPSPPRRDPPGGVGQSAEANEAPAAGSGGDDAASDDRPRRRRRRRRRPRGSRSESDGQESTGKDGLAVRAESAD